MGNDPAAPRNHPERAADGPPEDVRGLAELAFGSLTGITGGAHARHLALLPVETLELNLADPAQRCFDDYELLEQIGEGGMGVVYRARQISLDREVAIKLLSAGPWASKDFIARFEREARNAARMQHPNIVTVYEVGSFEGLQFFSMRLVEGESLSAKLRRGECFDPKVAARLLRTVAEAVDYAHNLGVLHLDLKPANVLLDACGTPYVADFGLARRLENALAVENDEVSGTPAYMAPEQAQVRAHKLTAATDIWGLGAILYELLTGAPPFRADTAQATVKLVLEAQVRAPRRTQPALPRDLEAIVLRCLVRDPAERYPSARALADDLARYSEGRPVHARPLNALQRIGRWARREPRLAATALLAFGILVAGLAATTQQWRRADASADAARDNLWATRAQAAQAAFADGDGFRGLRPLTVNLTEMDAAARKPQAAVERLRIGTILANAPQLTGLIPARGGEQVSSIAIAPDGRHFAVASSDWRGGGAERFVRQYDAETLRETWATSTRDRTFLMAYGDANAPHGGLHYSADGRHLLVALTEQPVTPTPRYSDMIAFDARDGHLIWPTGLPERQADVVYDDVLKHALVRFRSDASLRWPDSAQFYEVDGWKPIGPRHTLATSLAADFWLPAPDGGAWLGSRDCVDFALYDVPELTARWRLKLPPTGIVRAWQFSHDGRWIALGSVDGTVRLVGVADGHAVEFASGPAERVIRIEFSADDRTLAAVDENGRLWSWDVASGAARGAPLPFVRTNGVSAAIRFAGDTLIGSGNSESQDAEVAYATLTPHAPFNNEIVPGAARLHTLATFGMAMDMSVAANRLVTGARDGIEVWRLPPSPLRAARAAPLQPLAQAFDGTRLPTVDGVTVRMIDAATGAPLSPRLRHPEPVRFAELAVDGHVLVTVAGRSVRVIDTATWRLRGPPLVLPQTPDTVALAQAAPVLVATMSTYEGGERQALVQRIDLARGEALGGPVRTAALQQFDLDPAGRHAFAATWSRTRPTEYQWIALETGKVECAPKYAALWNAALTADGRGAWLLAATGANQSPTLHRWDFAACRELPLAGHTALRDSAVLMARGGGLVVHNGGKEALIRIDVQGRTTAAIGQAINGSMYEFALSADGERAAIATRNAVHLLDAQGGRRLSAPLAAPIGGDDAIARLAFSPDGTRLVARTINHRWLFWNLPRSEMDAAALSSWVRALDPDPVAPLTDAERKLLAARLRRDMPAPRAAPSAPGAVIDFPPVAGSAVDPRFVPLDLAPALNVPLVGRTWPEPFERGDQPTLAPGLQRYLGVDYRVDGGVQLGGGGSAIALAPELRRSVVVPVPDVHARRLHVLAFMHIPMNPGVPSRTFGQAVLLGTHAREARLDIRTLRDIITDTANPKRAAVEARVAFTGTPSVGVRRGGNPMQPWSSVYAVALDVPPDLGPIRGLRFEIADGPMEAPLFYAATLERADASPPDAGPEQL